MPWKEATKMELKLEFVQLADQPEANMSQLCARFGISRPTGYKWLRRWCAEGREGLQELSRQPHHCPHQTSEQMEQAIVEARSEHPCWGGRKLADLLGQWAEQGRLQIDEKIPAPSTITTVLERRGLLDPPESPKRQGPWKRFELEAPNLLWQMDFKGEIQLVNGQWCYPLTIIDDHSRFCLAVKACPDQRRQTVKSHLEAVFGRYGLPRTLLCDNGAPWGSPIRDSEDQPYYTTLAAWLMQLGVNIRYSGPGHPQTHGKNERFNRTLNDELLQFAPLQDYRHAQQRMETWRNEYNTMRPHESLDMQKPTSRYQPSNRALPPSLPPINYGEGQEVRKVSSKGIISFKGHSFRVGKAFTGYPVAVRASSNRHEYHVYFCHQHIRTITLNK